MKPLLTLKEAAEILRVSERTLRRYINENELKAVKLRGVIRIKEEDLEEFIKKRGIFDYPPPTGSPCAARKAARQTE